ncbi:crp fnr-family transcriptional regulator [Novosphingobium sp. Rr 2-17]|uniref:Crp/Fnr family transcriptional regulator n=1 Tax=Novosphingobium sp. Rr 2-17 TaxID=555793 RepID=UPI0002698F1E|nr:Crp/Fnr family transcriptional regulator [Novosphingobium sp. Rr 2-17]EIZ78105.1 crp fnr-family transcriptional regulator [Novosphingobium sp. Rr 2-17]
MTERFLRNRRNVTLTIDERARLERSVAEVRYLKSRVCAVRAGERLDRSLLLVEGIMCRYIDHRGLRQIVAIHVPGEFVDLHAHPFKAVEYSIDTLINAIVAVVPHEALDEIGRDQPALERKLWHSILLDASIHQAWLFRLGCLDAIGRVAHFLCETNVRLLSAGLSNGLQFRLALTQADLAEICGLTSVHVNRVIRQLREDRLCTFRSGIVDIHDLEHLKHRAKFDATYLYAGDPHGTTVF